MTFAAFSMTVASSTRSPLSRRVALAALVVASVAALPSVARADAPGATHADSLFREGRTLLDAKRFDDACPKLAESQKLEPGAGTLLALALCHEGQGKTATAYNELVEAAALGKRVGRPELAAAAQKRAQVMEPQLSRVVVRMPSADAVDYDVKCDGEPLEKAQWNTPILVDPGEHKVDVSGKGKTSRSYVVRLSGAGTVELVVDKLEEAARVAVAKPAPVRLQVTPVSGPPAEDASRGGTQRTIGIVIVGLGIAGIGTGAYFGGRALSESAEGRRSCKTAPCPADANDANERAKGSFATTVVTVAAGTGAIALGTIIYLLAPSASTRATAPSSRITARFVPEVSPTQASLGLTGAF
jgi:hypothetical protein